MTAIDKEFCNANALSCGVIQNVLEKAPGLVFVNGVFRHRYTILQPSPPPSPHAPPRLFAYAPRPPSPPPPPGTPPPYYAVRKKCNSNQTQTTHSRASQNRLGSKTLQFVHLRNESRVGDASDVCPATS